MPKRKKSSSRGGGGSTKAASEGRKGADGGGESAARLAAARTALSRAEDWLSERPGYYGFLGRKESERGAPELAGHLSGDLRARQNRDGSWDGDLFTTAETVWQLLDLGVESEARPVVQGTSWIYKRRDADGAFGEGCSPARHEQGICEHFIRGFFSPGPPDESQEVTLPNGQTVTSDSSARLLVSERSLRTLLRVNPYDARAESSVEGLRGVPLFVEYGGSFTPAVLVGALQTLAWAPDAATAEIQAGLETLADGQEKDGTWPNIEFFFVLETLVELDHPVADRLLENALDRLLETQYKNGAWGRTYQDGQTLIGMRALKRLISRLRS